MEENQELEKFEEIVNDYLFKIREIEYSLVHFIKKSNKSTALSVRNTQRELNSSAKDFKNLSIKFFKG